MNETKLTVMERISDTVTETGARLAVKATNALGKLMTKKAGKILVTLPLALSFCAITVYAQDANGKADATINEIIEQLKIWIPRLGAMIVVVGGVQMGIGFKDDDATGKTRGMQCMIGGAIVAAVGKLVAF